MTTRYSRPEPDIAELTNELSEATTEAQSALKAGGQYSRDYVNAEFMRRNAERRLDAAKHRAAEKERLANLSPSEIVDRMMER
jgi:hypothetical protein